MAPYGITYLVKILILVEFDLIISIILMSVADVMVYNILISFKIAILIMKSMTSFCGDLKVATSDSCKLSRFRKIRKLGVGSLCVKYLLYY